MLNDSGTEIEEEFLIDFIDESTAVLTNLHFLTNAFHQAQDNHLFEKYGQQVDRIMGAAYTLSLTEVGDMARLGKEVGYKASQVTDMGKLLTVQSLLSQLTRCLESIMKSLKRNSRPDSDQYRELIVKLSKASEQLGNLRTSVKA